MLISKKGREYRKAVEGLCLATKVRQMTGRLSVHIKAYPPDRRKRDVDNLLKPVLDALTHGGCWEDDSQIDVLLIERCEVRRGGELLIEIEEMGGA